MPLTADLPSTAYNDALARHRAGDLAAAEPLYRTALAADDGDARATQMLGVLAFQTGRAVEAIGLLRRAAGLDPGSPECHGNLGSVLAAAGHAVEAAAAHRRAIALRPDFAEAHCNLGNALRQAGDPAGAAAAYRRAVALDAGLADAHRNLGLLLADAGDPAAATALAHACRLRPSDGAAHLDLAHALARSGDAPAAADAYAAALALCPGSADGWLNLGAVLDRLGRPADAAAAFARAVALRPDSADAHFNLAVARRSLGQHAAAVAGVCHALHLRPDWPQAWNNLGVWLTDAGQLADAADALGRAVAVDAGYADAHANLGNVWRRTGRSADAVAAYRRAVALRPDHAEALSNLGATLQRAGDLDEAVAVLTRAIALRPDLGEPRNNLGNAHKDAGDLDAALAAYARATALRPDDADAASNAVYTLLYHPAADAAAHRHAAVAWADRHAAPLTRAPATPHANDRTPGRRLRVGYVAPDFRDHCQSFFTVPLLAHHDPAAVEVVCYADVAAADAVTSRLRSLAHAWRDTAGLSDAALADQVRADGVDVLVDLTVHMAHHRLLAFARRPAPVQVTWLGYPGTTGLTAIDYRLTDPHLDPPGPDRDALYAERSVRLPDTFWCYDPLVPATAHPVTPPPSVADGSVTFGCLNNFCKVTPATLRLWAAVLLAVPRSRLLLLAPPGSARDRVLATLAAAGVAPGRVAFVPRQSRPAYLDTYRRIDVGLDTVPYAGHTTSLDAYWMGVPVVTLVGQSAVARAGLSQLTNLALPDLAAADPAAFVAAAAGLAADAARLAGLRATLRDRLTASPLMDAPRFARGVEAAYRQMWVTYCQAAT